MILQEVDGGKPVVIAAREHGVSPATIHRWKGKYEGMTLSELKRLKAKKMVSPLARRSVVEYLIKQVRCSRRRACTVVGLSRSLLKYMARKRRDEAKLVRKIHALAIHNGRYGYRRVTVLLR